MQLAALPITPDRVAHYQFSGQEQDMFLATALDDVGDRVQPRTVGSQIAPELLDPFVFWQFVSGLMGQYTVNGMPFNSNWRLMPAATRMAKRLGALPLAQALQDGEEEMRAWDIADLDAYDTFSFDINISEQKEKYDTLFQRFDKRFELLISEAAPTYGHFANGQTGGDALLTALCEWISDQMPREVLPTREAVIERIAANHNWAYDNVDNHGYEFTRSFVGHDIFVVLNGLGLRIAAVTQRSSEPHKLAVIPTAFRTTDGQDLIAFGFGDGIVVADAVTLQERGRSLYAAPLPRPAQLVPYANIAKRPKITLNREAFTTSFASIFRPFAETLKYKQ